MIRRRNKTTRRATYADCQVRDSLLNNASANHFVLDSCTLFLSALLPSLVIFGKDYAFFVVDSDIDSSHYGKSFRIHWRLWYQTVWRWKTEEARNKCSDAEQDFCRGHLIKLVDNPAER